MSIDLPYKTIDEVIEILASSNPAQAKAALLTLHFLFPHELLPALDLLDRHLITRLIVNRQNDTATHNEVYYVQSASASTSRTPKTSRHSIASAAAYEVRLSAWNCSCPAFAFAAFGKSFGTALGLGDNSEPTQAEENVAGPDTRLRLGGVLTQPKTGVPVCKHILATYLGAAAPQMLGSGIREREVNEAEAGGWAGGWGD